MHRDRSFDAEIEMTAERRALMQDLSLDTLFQAMTTDEDFLPKPVRAAVLSPTQDLDTILYRQAVLRDCLSHEAVVRDLYRLTVEVVELEKRGYWWGFSETHPGGLLARAREELKMLIGMLARLKSMAEKSRHIFESEGFAVFFRTLASELPGEQLVKASHRLDELLLDGAIAITAQLGEGNKGANYGLVRPRGRLLDWTRWRLRSGKKYTLRVEPGEEGLSQALSELKDRGLDRVANALGQAADQIRAFFQMLRTELAFYIGCLNLRERLVQAGISLCFPVPLPTDDRRHVFKGLYDVCLALELGQAVVGNDLSLSGKDLVVITGANEGGKSTFLRSIGLAQLMMQCGMFVAAQSLAAEVCTGLFTHYRREEDTRMKSGKLDEELQRMSAMVDRLKPGCLVLLNESFAATNELEGSAIAMQIVSALVERGIKVFFVTHLSEFARQFLQKGEAGAMFLRAERQADGTRSFRMVEGEPLETGFARDLFNQIFGSLKKSAAQVTEDRVVPGA